MKILSSFRPFCFFALAWLFPVVLHAQQGFIAGPTEVCEGQCPSYFFSFQGGTTPVDVLWFAEPSGDTLGYGNPITFCPNGPFSILYAVAFINDDLVLTDSLVITYIQPDLDFIFNSNAAELCPAANANPGGPNQDCEVVCAGSTVTYTWEVMSNTGIFFVVGLNVIGAESYDLGLDQATITWGEPGIGTINAVVEYYCGNYTFTRCVEILEDPVAAFTAMPAPANDTITICQGQEVLFQNTSQYAESFSWNFGNGLTSTDANPSTVYSNPGTYSVELTAYNACLCSNSTSLTVVVLPGESPLVDCIGTICENTIGTYTAQAMCGAYTWSVSSNGSIIDGGGVADDYITVDWGEGPEGIIELAVESCASLSTCLEPAFLRVPILSENAQIEGRDNVCRGDITSYSITPFEGTSFNWSVSPFGTLLEGQGTEEIVVEWFSGSIPAQAQWVAVAYDNCYLGCGGADTLEVRINPEFYVTGPIEVCSGGATIHQARSTPGNSDVLCNWTATAADGTVVWASASPTAMPSISWNVAPGVYQLTVEPDDADAFCTPAGTTIMQVSAPPAAVDAILGDTLICPGQLYTYEAVSSLSPVRYIWTINDGGAISTREGKKINLSFGNSPPYELSVVQLSPLGCESEPYAISLSTIPPLSIQGPADACNESTSIFSTQSFTGPAYAWTVSPAGAGTIISEPDKSDIEVLWHYNGPATVSVQSCSQSVSFNLTVHALPEPVAQHPAALCPGVTAIVQATTAFSSYAWYDVNGNLVSTDAMPQLEAGGYRLVATDGNGCIGDTTFRIIRYPESDISISTPDPNVFCNAGPSTRLYAVNADAGYAYQWYQGSTPVGTNSPTYTATAFGAYYVEITDQNGCAFPSNIINVYEDCSGGGGLPTLNCDIPGVSFDMQSAGGCNERSYQINNLSYIPGTIQWVFDDPASGIDNFSGLPNPSHTYSQAGFYRVLMLARFPSAGNPADTVLCGDYRADTVYLVANFSADTACAGLPVEFTDLSTFLPFTSITAWAWDFGDPASGVDNSSALANPGHNFSSPGQYTVTLVVTSSEGCTSSISQDITVYGPPAVNFAEPSVSCEDLALPFLADVGPEVTSVRWDFGDPASGAANGSEQFQSYHRYETPGVYTTTLYAQSIYGCENSFSRSITIEANTLGGDISSSLPSPICEGDTAILSAPSGGLSWLWSTGSIEDTTHVLETGIYSLTLTDDKGCTYAPAPMPIEVLAAPDAIIRAVAYNDFQQPSSYFYDGYEICEGEEVFLEVIENTAYSYSWSNGDTGPATEFSEDRGNLLGPGSHDIFVTVTNNTTGCSFTEGPFTIVVHPAPASVLIGATPAGLNCESTPVTFNVLGPDPGLDYQWSNGATGASLTTSAAGSYFVTAINAFGCEAESNTLDILPGPDISLVPNGCYTRCRPDTLCLPNIPGVVSYQWYFNGNPVSGPSGTVPELIATESGAYYLEMMDNQGCSLQSDPLNLELFDGTGTIQGQVYFDVNDNGLIDAADTLYSGAGILLLQGGLPAGSTLSNLAGAYAFPNIAAGPYTVQVDTASLPQGLGAWISQVDTTLSGCDTNIPLDWLLHIICQPDTLPVNLSGCSNNPPVYNGLAYTQDTTFMAAYQSIAGCDSVEVVSITVFAADSTSLGLQACTGQTADYNGTALNPGQQMDFTFTNAAGCDSIVTVIVAEILPTDSTLLLQACSGDSLLVNGVYIPAGQQQQFTIANAAGCDSTLTVVVEAVDAITTTLSLQACSGDSALYNGAALPAGSQADFTFSASSGCDSIVTVIVEALQPSYQQLTLMDCPVDSAVYQGIVLYPGQQMDFVFTNAAGCDSIVTVILPDLPELSLSVATLASCPNKGTGTATASITGSPAQPVRFSLDGGDSFQESNVFEGLAGGSYELLMADALGCTAEGAFEISITDALAVEIEATPISCENPVGQLNAVVLSGDDGNLSLTWSDGTQGATFASATPGIYTLEAVNNCEALEFGAELESLLPAEVSLLYIPNAFSPNDDGANDSFRAFPTSDAIWTAYELMVFDRWGNLLFRSEDPTEGWDGRLKGSRLNTGVYVYHLKGKVESCGRVYEVEREGDVMLVR